jgi:hypothetical protein
MSVCSLSPKQKTKTEHPIVLCHSLKYLIIPYEMRLEVLMSVCSLTVSAVFFGRKEIPWAWPKPFLGAG